MKSARNNISVSRASPSAPEDDDLIDEAKSAAVSMHQKALQLRSPHPPAPQCHYFLSLQCSTKGFASISRHPETSSQFFTSVTLIRCQPNWVFTGPTISPGLARKAATSNGFTIWPLPKNPRSPPDLPEGHCE